MSLHRTANEGGSPRHQQTLFATEYSRQPKPALPPANWSVTSQASAESIRDAAPNLRTKCFEALCRAGYRGLTRHEIAAATEISLATVCPRVGELLRLGMIIESGHRPSPTGRAAGVLIASQDERIRHC